MTGPEAAAYLGISPATFTKWVANGTLPKPIPNTRRWDRKAIDLALDKTSGIVAPSATNPDDVLEQWIKEDEARKAAAGAGVRKAAERRGK
jgi:excisionase family DNA binding protein